MMCYPLKNITKFQIVKIGVPILTGAANYVIKHTNEVRVESHNPLNCKNKCR